MSTFRIQKNKDNPYVMINKGMLQDSILSARAKGLLAYLLSLPNDWQIYELEIARHFSDGRDSIRAGVKELIRRGYVIRGKRLRNELGQLRGYEYDVYEVPQNQTLNPYDGKPYVGESDTTNNDKTNDLHAGQTQRERELIAKREAYKERLDDIEFEMLKQIEQENASTDR